MTLAREIYRLTECFPKSELYGLVNQLRRAAVSVPSNIAEGFSRKSVRENAQFIAVAFGSTSEIDTQLILARDLGFGESAEYQKSQDVLVEVRKMLNSMLSKLKLKVLSSNG